MQKGVLNLEEAKMNKKSILENIEITRRYVTDFVNNLNELSRLKSKPLKFGKVLHVVSFIIIYLYIFKPLFMGSLILALIVYYFGYKILNSTLQKRKIAKNAEKIKKLEEQQEILENEINSLTLIPSKYLYIGALNKFYDYLSVGRADDLKEAMNIYEQEIRHEEQVNEIKNMQALQTEALRKADTANTLAWMNLFKR